MERVKKGVGSGAGMSGFIRECGYILEYLPSQQHHKT